MTSGRQVGWLAGLFPSHNGKGDGMLSLRKLGGLVVLVAMSMIASTLDAAEEKEVKVKLADCPAAVQKTLQREANGGTINEVDKELDDGKTIYEVDVKIDGKNYELTVAENGTLLGKVLDEDEEEEEKEEKLKLSDCPEAVQKTLKREANSATIDAVDKETEDGKTVYETDVKIDGKNYEIKVAADGTLISKTLDDEDEDDEDDD